MITAVLASASLFTLPAVAPAQRPLPPLKVRGRHLVDPRGKPVLLKGCNVGNWLLIEFWMLGLAGRPGAPADQYSLVQLLKRRFGDAEAERLMDVYRSSWMTERDWRNIKTYGFNVVRVPIDYRLLEDDERPMRLRSDAWQWVDKAVNEAERHGLYVILDLHGVQGGQSVYDHTGRVNQNRLWSDAKNQERMAWLWTQIAKRYRARNAVVAYDPMNEPYGGQKDQVVSVFERTYRAIRAVDPQKLVFAHGHTDNFDHFGDPKVRGWKNVGFQMHYYPGLFGDAPRVRSNVRHLNRLPAVAEKLRKLDVPFLVGEMNIVLTQNGGAPMMRRVFDAHAKYGWMTTMWSYKVLSPTGGLGGGSWGMYYNTGPAQLPNLETASKPQVEAYFRSFATQPLQRYEALHRYLSTNAPVPPLPAEEQPRTVAPNLDRLRYWESTDINGAHPGGMEIRGDDAFDLYGSGEDIWGSSDQFRFLHQAVEGDFDLEVTLEAMEDIHGYAKAGLMVRESLAPEAATALLSTFPNGTVQLAVREKAKAAMAGTDGPKITIPGARMRVTRRGAELTFSVNGQEVARRSLSALSGKVLVGPVALSHANGELIKVSYRDLRLVKPPR